MPESQLGTEKRTGVQYYQRKNFGENLKVIEYFGNNNK